ncbi:MAG: hypothetical protein AAF125_24595, partial [Chloroflexota bacterium]
MNLYTLMGRLTPTAVPPTAPSRVLIVRPCCIGDVVMATAALIALRQAHPNAHISWLSSAWSQQVVAAHPALDAVVEVEETVYLPSNVADFRALVQLLRAGGYDLIVSLVRSPRMSAAAMAAGIPYRAGIDSAGRGFGYNIRAPIDPTAARHEVDIYLDV